LTTSLTAEALATIDRCCESHAASARIPGMAWGVVRGGALVHVGGTGTTDVDGGHTPGLRTLFRIASMTKSFTAAAVLSLRDEGRLRLDDPVAAYVPELAGLRGPTADSPAITLRHLLSMDSGLATDDPWADRHLDIDAEALGAVFRHGAGFAHPTGTAYQYSNLGFAMLGRVVAIVTGGSCQEAITTRLLEPLGMRDTVWVPRTDQVDRAVGHGLVNGAAVHDGSPLGDGGLAPVGGLWSTVADLAMWVAFFLDAFPPRDDRDDGPLRRASRREMQRTWRPDRLRLEQIDLYRGLRAGPPGYGFGLLVGDDLSMGPVVSHGGSLPGYGSYMRWLPQRDLGIVALGNAGYEAVALATRTSLEELQRDGLLPPPREAWAPEPLRRAATDLVGLLNQWTDERAQALFTDNVALDESFERRSTDARRVVEELGPLAIREVRARSLAEAEVVAEAERGQALIEFLLHVGAVPAIQAYRIRTIPKPSDAQLTTNASLCALVRPDVTTADLRGLVLDAVAADAAANLARLASRLGPCSVGPVPGRGGRATFQWLGQDGDVDVTIAWLDGSAVVRALTLALPTLGGV
jgi:CubicO group peptidase (beta-lactamase class C family)